MVSTALTDIINLVQTLKSFVLVSTSSCITLAQAISPMMRELLLTYFSLEVCVLSDSNWKSTIVPGCLTLCSCHSILPAARRQYFEPHLQRLQLFVTFRPTGVYTILFALLSASAMAKSILTWVYHICLLHSHGAFAYRSGVYSFPQDTPASDQILFDPVPPFNSTAPLPCLEVTTPVVKPSDEDTQCTQVLMHHSFGNSYGKPFIGNASCPLNSLCPPSNALN